MNCKALYITEVNKVNANNAKISYWSKEDASDFKFCDRVSANAGIYTFSKSRGCIIFFIRFGASVLGSSYRRWWNETIYILAGSLCYLLNHLYYVIKKRLWLRPGGVTKANGSLTSSVNGTSTWKNHFSRSIFVIY